MKYLQVAAAAFLLLAAASVSAGDDERGGKAADAKSLLGTYTIVSGERGGKPLPKEEFAGSIVTFAKDKVYGTDKDKKEFFAATYKVDTSSKPWKLSMVSTAPKSGEKAGGVIMATGDTVKLAYALPGGTAPTELKTKTDKQQMFVLKRKGGTSGDGTGTTKKDR